MKMKYGVMSFVGISVLAAGVGGAFAAEKEDLTRVTIPTELSAWIGLYLGSDDMDPLPDEAGRLGRGSGRAGSPKAAEYYSVENSPSGGFLYKSITLPHRLHAEAEIRNGNDWYGDFRHSYLDIFQFRFLPRRGYHNLDNIEVYDFDNTKNLTTTSNIERLDAGAEYGFTTDMNTLFLRLKPRNYPLHVYGLGEIIKRKGSQQQRFVGGSGYFRNRLRTTEARGIDSETREYTFGASAHLGPVEVDLSHADRSFGADVDNPMYYDYTPATTLTPPQEARAAGTYAHNLYPNLKASTNTLRIHSSHTGRFFGSATLSRIDKENEYSGVEAENLLGYAEVYWLPMTKLALSGHLRHQENEEEQPVAKVSIPGGKDFWANKLYYDYRTAKVKPGMKSEISTATAMFRYSPLSRLTLNGAYSREWKTYDTETAHSWGRPEEITRDTYDLNANWRVMPGLTLNGRVVQQEWSVKETDHYKHIDPEHSTQGILTATWTPRDWLTAMARADATWQDSDSIAYFRTFVTGGPYQDDPTVNNLDVVRRNYLASLIFMFSDRFSVTPTYTFSQVEREQDLTFDPNSRSEEAYHNFMVEATYVPIDRLSLTASADYTTGRGDYDLTGAFSAAQPINIGLISQTRVEEHTYRLEGEYDLGRGWTTGLDVLYGIWEDESWDNPAEGSFFSSLMKVGKKL